MAESLTKIWIHAVFGTRNIEPLIVPQLKGKLYKHINEQFEKEYKIWVRMINGTSDHIHILFLLDPVYALTDIIKNIKRESAQWVNQKEILDKKFAWQAGFGAFSVSESTVELVERYIENQNEHHREMSFLDEYEEFMDIHGVNYTSRSASGAGSDDE
jgi:putative transposase